MSGGRTRAVLTIAGSDSGGGAGIQADLKAFAAVGVHGMSAITAITAQSTVGVIAVHAVPGEIIEAQVRAVADDVGVDAVKIGMLGTEATIEAVAAAVQGLGPVPVVVDPVMVSESGAPLLDPSAHHALAASILPLATVVTPNLSEAQRLTGAPEERDGAVLASALRRLGPDAALVTGGHAEGVDVLDDGSGAPLRIEGPLHPGGAAHGSGCTHSSALAGLLARGFGLRDAAREARRIAGEAVARGLREVGSGPGPVDVLGIRSRAVPPA